MALCDSVLESFSLLEKSLKCLLRLKKKSIFKNIYLLLFSQRKRQAYDGNYGGAAQYRQPQNYPQQQSYGHQPAQQQSYGHQPAQQQSYGHQPAPQQQAHRPPPRQHGGPQVSDVLRIENNL